MIKLNLKHLLIGNWRRKSVSIVVAIIIWIFVNNSITISKTVPNIVVEVVNIPPDKTIEGLRFGSILDKKMTLTIKGKKSVVELLNSENLRIFIDASEKSDNWSVEIKKNNLRCLDPEVYLANNIKEITHSEFKVKITPLVTERIPVIIPTPAGKPPQGYQFLEVWPAMLPQMITGPKSTIEELKNRGLELRFNLQDITKEELDALQTSSVGVHSDEIDFLVPESWKYIVLPIANHPREKLNSPNASNLRLTFLRKELLPLLHSLPVSVFYGLKLDPETHPLIPSHPVDSSKGSIILNLPLYTRDVGRLFLDVVQGNIQILIIAKPKGKEQQLKWIIQFINPTHLEDVYVERAMAESEVWQASELSPKLREQHYRSLFRNYMQKFKLFKENGDKLSLKASISPDGITLREK